MKYSFKIKISELLNKIELLNINLKTRLILIIFWESIFSDISCETFKKKYIFDCFLFIYIKKKHYGI